MTNTLTTKILKHYNLNGAFKIHKYNPVSMVVCSDCFLSSAFGLNVKLSVSGYEKERILFWNIVTVSISSSSLQSSVFLRGFAVLAFLLTRCNFSRGKVKGNGDSGVNIPEVRGKKSLVDGNVCQFDLSRSSTRML